MKIGRREKKRIDGKLLRVNVLKEGRKEEN